MKKILITGGAGFIGANLIKYMIDKYKNYKVVNLDLLTYAANLNNLKDIERNSNYKFIKGDIANREFIFKLFKDEKFDIVINCAAESHVDRSITEPGIFIKSNVVGTQVLLDACREYSVGRFHQVSTDEVYGDLPIDNPNLLFKEDGIIRPSSPYSASKASADLLVNSYYRTYNTPITISRCSNNYGPFQYNEKLIPLMISKILKNEKLPVYGDGRNIRDWLHVYDHCSAIDLIVHKGKEGEVYNIGGNCELSNIEIVKFLLENLNRSEDLITFVKDRPGHDLRYAVDSSKIERELGWDRKYNFSYGIIETINWYKENL
ncbi:dTDP-glucose 4,6-dehydratase [Paraclostridium bifermentans]|uniref:dTDP-glucose 4,6-dehydratase n=1 Tax=Paraclostridium bifermentans TaxID=1490 RepID=UPI00290E82A7|nr:dTDP-glucose 4,6-dehydratase [Paraclostridium bifermentans]MDU3804024.1 dTDP-glucose 4,6-dehydratase [Paraclostridium bifermentans]